MGCCDSVEIQDTVAFVSSTKSIKLMSYEYNREDAPSFTALDVCNIFVKSNEIEAQLNILSGRHEYITAELGKLRQLVPFQVDGLKKTRDYLVHHVLKSYNKLTSLRKETKDILEGKQTIERALAKMEVKDVRQTEWLLWVVTSSNSNLKGNTLNELLDSRLQNLPNLSKIAAGYEMQTSIVKGLADIVNSVSDESNELFYDVDNLKSHLTVNGEIDGRQATSYFEPEELAFEDFDYYGFSSVAPIVPPIDLSWLEEDDNDTNAAPFDSPSVYSISNSKSGTSVNSKTRLYSISSAGSFETRIVSEDETAAKTPGTLSPISSVSISAYRRPLSNLSKTSMWSGSPEDASFNPCLRSESYVLQTFGQRNIRSAKNYFSENSSELSSLYSCSGTPRRIQRPFRKRIAQQSPDENSRSSENFGKSDCSAIYLCSETAMCIESPSRTKFSQADESDSYNSLRISDTEYSAIYPCPDTHRSLTYHAAGDSENSGLPYEECGPVSSRSSHSEISLESVPGIRLAKYDSSESSRSFGMSECSFILPSCGTPTQSLRSTSASERSDNVNGEDWFHGRTQYRTECFSKSPDIQSLSASLVGSPIQNYGRDHYSEDCSLCSSDRSSTSGLTKSPNIIPSCKSLSPSREPFEQMHLTYDSYRTDSSIANYVDIYPINSLSTPSSSNQVPVKAKKSFFRSVGKFFRRALSRLSCYRLHKK
ncbi:hypothetical protein ScPMuIL_009475 [Solemya velum]